MAKKIKDFNIDKAMSLIKENFTEDEVTAMFHTEWPEHVNISMEELEEEGYNDEFQWYMDHNNNEAQDIIAEKLLEWYEKEHGALIENDYYNLLDKIKESYDIFE